MLSFSKTVVIVSALFLSIFNKNNVGWVDEKSLNLSRQELIDRFRHKIKNRS